MLYLVEEIINFSLADVNRKVSDIDTSHIRKIKGQFELSKTDEQSVKGRRMWSEV